MPQGVEVQVLFRAPKISHQRISMNQSDALLSLLKDVIPNEKKRLLEIGAGKGELASFLSLSFPKLQWIVSEKASALLPLKKLHPQAISFEVGKDSFPKMPFDYVLMADFLSEITWKEAKGLIKDFGHRLREGSQVFILGNFRYDGKFLSAADEALDQQLKIKNAKLGLRAFEDISECMKKNGLELYKDYEVAEGKHLLVYTRIDRIQYDG